MGARRSRDASGPSWTLESLRTHLACGALLALYPSHSGVALLTGRASLSFFALGALHSLGTLRTGCASGTSRSKCAWLANRPNVSLCTSWPHRSSVAYKTSCSRRPFGSSCAYITLSAQGTLEANGPCHSHWPLGSLSTLRPLRPRRPLRTLRSLRS